MGKKRKAVTAVRGFFLEEERKNGALIIDELKDKNLLITSEGAQIVDLEEHKLGVCMIKIKNLFVLGVLLD